MSGSRRNHASRRNVDSYECSEVFCIKDTGIIAYYFVATIGLAGGTLCLLGNRFINSETFSLLLSLVLLVVGVIASFLVKSHSSGIIVDVANDFMEFPSGFTRDQVLLSEIREISRETKRNKRRNSKGKETTSISHSLDFNGSFGATSLTFSSRGKRDELYSLLREIILR